MAAALAGFDDWQRARGMGEKTRRAYGVDLAQLAEWAAGRELGPLRSPTATCAASPAWCRERGAAKSTVAASSPRSAPSTASSSSAASWRRTRPSWSSSPKKDAYLPQVLKPDEVAELLERIPGATPLDLRDRALFELAYAAGLRAEELVNLDLDERRRRRRGGARGGQGRPHARGARGRARLARARPLPDARRARCSTRGERGAVPLEERPAPVHLGRAAAAAPPGPPGRASPRTRCATPSRPTCWRAAPTCARSRSCSATPVSARPRPTLG